MHLLLNRWFTNVIAHWKWDSSPWCCLLGFIFFAFICEIWSSNTCNFLRMQWQLSLIPSSLGDSIKGVEGRLAGVMAHLSIHEFPGSGIGSCLIPVVQYCPRSSLRSLSGSFESKSFFLLLTFKKPSLFLSVSLCVLSALNPTFHSILNFCEIKMSGFFFFKFNW